MSTKDNELNISDVKKLIDEWRDTKTDQNTKIPDDIWESIFPLLKQYPRGRVLKVLGISATQLKNRLKKAGRYDEFYRNPDDLCEITTLHQTDFRTVSLEEVSPIETIVVEFKRDDGRVMNIHATSACFGKLISEFFEGSDDPNYTKT